MIDGFRFRRNTIRYTERNLIKIGDFMFVDISGQFMMNFIIREILTFLIREILTQFLNVGVFHFRPHSPSAKLFKRDDAFSKSSTFLLILWPVL